MKLKIVTLLLLNTVAFARYNPSQEKAIICGVCKNVAQFLPHMIRSIETLATGFLDYQIIIYENNSSDNTPQLLKSWMSRNNKVIVFSEQVSHADLLKRVKSTARRDQAPCRMEMIAYARNVVLKEAMQSNYDDYRFIIMTDLDFAQGWNPQSILQSFEIDEQWDCIAAHGTKGRNIHYDRYAFRDEQYPLGPELIGEDFWYDVSKPVYLAPNSGLKKVYSAFGGLAIYQRAALKDCWYSGFVTTDLEKLFDRIINKELTNHNYQYQTYKRTIGAHDNHNLPIKFQANSGYDGPVCCEHSALHASMILKGHDKIYVNPNLICKY